MPPINICLIIYSLGKSPLLPGDNAHITDVMTISETDEDQFLESGSSDLDSMGRDPSIHATANRIDIPSTEIIPVFHFVPSMDLTGKITQDGKCPIHEGSFSDVYAGFLSLETMNTQKS